MTGTSYAHLDPSLSGGAFEVHEANMADPIAILIDNTGLSMDLIYLKPV